GSGPTCGPPAGWPTWSAGGSAWRSTRTTSGRGSGGGGTARRSPAAGPGRGTRGPTTVGRRTTGRGFKKGGRGPRPPRADRRDRAVPHAAGQAVVGQGPPAPGPGGGRRAPGHGV